MSTIPPDGRVLPLRTRRGGTRAERVVAELVGEASAALAAVAVGDLDLIFIAHRALNRAVGVVLDNRLSSAWPSWPTCPTCGAEVSHGRCWGCGSPPERAS